MTTPLRYIFLTNHDADSGMKHWAIGEAIHNAGLAVGIYQGLNNVFTETLERRPKWKAEEGKYFLEEGRSLIELAESNGLKLAVNQNGRWAPHFSYMRNAID